MVVEQNQLERNGTDVEPKIKKQIENLIELTNLS